MGLVRLAVVVCVLVVVGSGAAYGDGGAVVAHGAGGSLSVTVFAAPVPLRAGPADVSVLVQRAGGLAPVLDADVWVELRSADGRGLRRRADHDQATNKLLYAASLTVPGPGRWQLRVEVERGADRSAVEATLRAVDAVPPAVRFWPWLSIPPLVVAVFLLHQWLRDRGARARGTDDRQAAAMATVSRGGEASRRRRR